MKKTVGLMALLLTAATAMVPAAMARDWDDHYENRGREVYAYRYNTHERRDREVWDRMQPLRNTNVRADYGRNANLRTNYGRTDYGRSNYGRTNYDGSDYGRSNYGGSDYGRSNYDRTDYGRTEYGRR